MTRALAYAAAWFAPAAILAWILWASGQNPAAALAYGWTGIAGAAAYVIVNSLAERRRRRAFDEDAAEAWLASPRGREQIPGGHPSWTAFADAVPLNDDIAVTHEGLARMHQDIRRDAERRQAWDDDQDDSDHRP